jgi:DNA-directed RNA polymerase specialized sigma24 family protein
MADAPPRTTRDIATLRERLARRAIRLGVPCEEAADVAGAAVAKAARERHPDPSLSFAQRSSAALRDEIADFWRRRSCRPDIDPEAKPAEPVCPPTAVRASEFHDAVRHLKEVLGADAVKYFVLHTAGYSEREIAELPGWDPLKASRVRRHIARKGPAALRAYLNLDHHKEAS